MTVIKKFMHKYFGTNIDIRLKSFRITLCFLILALACAVLCSAILNGGLGSLLLGLLSIVLLSILMPVSERIRNKNLFYWICLFLLDDILMINIFVRSNGIVNYMQTWIFLGFFLIFLLLDGKWMYSLYTITMIIYSIGVFTFLHEYGLKTVLLRMFATIFITVALGYIIRKQLAQLYNEKAISDDRKKEIETISAAKANFFNNLSHEIRTPIDTIVGLNEITLREDVSNDIYENAVNIKSASKDMLTIMDDIIDMSKIELGNIEIAYSEYKVGFMIDELIDMIWVRAAAKGLDFKIDIDENLPSGLIGDDVRIKQILTNILTNAVKYTEKGNVTFKVFGEEIKPGEYLLKASVRDTGVGIKKEHIDKLFDSFRRVDEENIGSIEGTGLGLALSKQLLVIMGGEITVESEYGKGSEFLISIPQGICDESAINIKEFGSDFDSIRNQTYKHLFEAPDAAILVVDDNEQNALVVKKLLRDTTIKVDVATSAEECLSKTLTSGYNIIIMDYLLPKMDGRKLLETIRKRHEGYCQKSPVIVMTANVYENAADDYKEMGFAGYLPKPVNADMLEQVVLQLLPDEYVEYKRDETLKTDYLGNVLIGKKKKVKITSVSVLDLPKNLIEEYDIGLLYSYVITDEGRFLDILEITSSPLMEYMAEGKYSTSVVESLEEYEAFFEKNLKESEEIIFFVLAKEAHPMEYDRAVRAANKFGHITVYDSMSMSAGIGVQALHAARMAQEGYSVEEIVRSLDILRSKIDVSFVVESTESLYRNNWIKKGVRDICNACSIHLLLKLKKGSMAFGGVLFGDMEDNAKKYIRSRLRHRRRIDDSIAIIAYAGISSKMERIISEEVQKCIQFKELYSVEVATGIAAHCGIGTFGILFIYK